MGAILLYGSLAETLKHECSEGGNINWPVVMRFHSIGLSQETEVNSWSVLSTMKLIKYLGCHSFPHVSLAVILWDRYGAYLITLIF